MQSRYINIMETDFNELDNMFENEYYNDFREEEGFKKLFKKYSKLKEMFFTDDFDGCDLEEFYHNEQELYCAFKMVLSGYRERYGKEFGWTPDFMDDEDSHIQEMCEDFFREAKDILELDEEVYIFTNQQRKLLELNGLVVNDLIVIEQ